MVSEQNDQFLRCMPKESKIRLAGPVRGPSHISHRRHLLARLTAQLLNLLYNVNKEIHSVTFGIIFSSMNNYVHACVLQDLNKLN